MILPEGFTVPPPGYLVTLVIGLVAVGLGLSRQSVEIDSRHIYALVPWILAGASFHAMYVVDALHPWIRPLGGTPSVYATAALIAGATWIVVDFFFGNHQGYTPPILAGTGATLLLVVLGFAISTSLDQGTFAPFWSGVALVVSLVVGGVIWFLVEEAVPRARAAGSLGALAVFSHVLDGVSTAVGVDVLGFGERTPLSRFILDVAAALPTADLLGSGWLFVLVKAAVAAAIVVLLADVVRDDVREGSLLLGFVAAVGLGPGAHNLLLFAIA